MKQPMIKAVFPGKYIQGEDALELLPELIGLFGKRGVILASPSAKNLLNKTADIIDPGKGHQIETFRGECNERELLRVERVVRNHRADIMIGMGGGKTIDTAKIVSDRLGLPVIIVPTIASTDAPCSGCAVIYSDDGIFESVYYQKMNPQIVLVDMTIMANAPVRFLVSGMGDALATWFEARSCTESHSINACGGYSTRAALYMAKLCYEILLSDGLSAKADNERHIVTPALNRVVEANTLLSGIGFESAGLASAHSVHNGLTALDETHAYYHGEKVAFGVLTGLHMNSAPPDEIETVYSFCESIGLPTTFEDIGLLNPSMEMLRIAAIKACAPEECIHHEMMKITPDMVLDAMIEVNAMGVQRKLKR